MKRFISLIIVLALVSCFSVTAFAADGTAVIDFDTVYQTIDGFGASYTWYSEWLVNNIHAEEGYDWIFNDTEFNILRFRDQNHVGEEHHEAEDGYPIYYAYYKAALDRGIEPLILVTSWGQYDRDLPWVAFTELSDKGYSYYTLAKDKNGEYMYDELAKFCVQSVKYFFDAGIPVDYFSISNEIELQERHVDENGKAREEAGFFFGQEEDEYHCCYWKAHIAVYNAFKEAFGEYAPKLLGAETMAGYPDLLHGYLDPIIENCPESLEIVGHHLYGTDMGERNLRSVGEAMSDYRIWQTEWYNNNYFEHAEAVMDELVYEGISAYLYWNGVWRDDLGNCIIEAPLSNSGDIQRRGNHYIMMHYSKFIKRGYQRIDVQDELGSKIAAFKSPDESKLIVVVMNPTEEDDYLTLDLGGREILSSQSWLSTEGGDKYGFSNEYMLDNGEYEDMMHIPARSLMTIDIDLEPNPNYVEPTVEKVVNPFVKTPKEPSALSTTLIAVLAAVAVVIVVAIVAAAVIVSKHIKKISSDANDNNDEH